MPILLNRAKGYQRNNNVVVIDRSGPWGNPFVIMEGADRSDVCDRHIAWLNEWIKNKEEIVLGDFSNKWVITHIHLLKGKDLACWCSPSKCHGEILIKLANEV